MKNKLLSFFLICLSLLGIYSLVSASPDYVIFNDWMEPTHYIQFSQYTLELREIDHNGDDNSSEVLVALYENGMSESNRIFRDYLEYQKPLTVTTDIKIEYTSVYSSGSIHMAKIVVWYKVEDMYVSRSWADTSDVSNKNELSLLRSDGQAGIVMLDGYNREEKVVILRNFGNSQVNNLVCAVDFPDDPSLSSQFAVSMPKTFIGPKEDMSIVLTFLSAYNSPQKQGTLTIKNSSINVKIPILIGGGSQTSVNTNVQNSDPFSSNPFGGSQVSVWTFYNNNHVLAPLSFQVPVGTKLIFYTYQSSTFLFDSVKLNSYTAQYNGKTIYYVEIPTTKEGVYSVTVSGQNHAVTVGEPNKQVEIQRGLFIEATPKKDKYKSGDKIILTVGSTEGVAFPNAVINVTIKNMTYNISSGSTFVVPSNADEDIFYLNFSTNYPNYGAAHLDLPVDNSVPLWRTALTWVAFFFVLFVAYTAVKYFVKGKTGHKDIVPDEKKIKAGLGGLR